MKLDIYELVNALSKKRRIFVSEADFQLELAFLIKLQYPDAVVRLEYCPQFNTDMHIDILVIIDERWIPIELKYKTKGCQKMVDGEYYHLKNHSAKDVNCYAYLKDIQRIETIRENVPIFEEGHTVMLTNDLAYLSVPTSEKVNYYAFLIHENAVKYGKMDWGENTSEGTKGRDCKWPIELKDVYSMKWYDYSRIDETNTGTFKFVINSIT